MCGYLYLAPERLKIWKKCAAIFCSSWNCASNEPNYKSIAIVVPEIYAVKVLRRLSKKTRKSQNLIVFKGLKIDQNMLFLSLTSLTKNKQNSIRKFKAFFQFKAIWNILALVNKFSLYPLHGKAINGKAQIFETFRLWRPLEQYAASQLLTPEYSHLQKNGMFDNKFVCFVCSQVQLYYIVWKQSRKGRGIL
jgi:hypothetical protein